jgi:hypothetical protein
MAPGGGKSTAGCRCTGFVKTHARSSQPGLREEAPRNIEHPLRERGGGGGLAGVPLGARWKY